MNKYRWLVKPTINEAIKQQFPELPVTVLQLLDDRGLTTQAQIDEFLHPDYSANIHDPYLFSQMKLVVDTLYQAKADGHKLAIFGDYDADGVCGSAILHQVFTLLNFDFVTYLPDREKEGYGLNAKAVKILADQGVKLVITVDCGISNVADIELANSLGLQVIITDHHHVPDQVPPALAIIHPGWDKNYPFKFLAGGGVAFKVGQALLRDSRAQLPVGQSAVALEKWLLDLASISTVADMVPLLGENRTIVKYGLIVLTKTKNLGLAKLMEVAAINQDKADATTIGWQLAPRINAAGRMAHANSAYELLTTANIEQAIVLAGQLNKRNTERQSITEKLFTEAKQQLGAVTADQPVLIAVGEKWNPGLLGLVSSKLTQEFSRPSLVLSDQGGESYVASGRSIKEFNLIEALEHFKDYFLRFGGHAGAAGFSLAKTKLEAFKKDFSAYVGQKLAGANLTPTLMIDRELILNEVNWDLIEALEEFKPFGENNYKPRFLLKNVAVVVAEAIGADKTHLRLLVSQGERREKIICFGFANVCASLKPGDQIDVVCELGINQWNGNREIQLSLVDIKLS
ncbi:MAG: single-stranded-DNA-specific exonuclease RecJ [Candidatus Komeilibacteria bacterium]|nr:single-stranded-DNA-specific exonuclease RecJ [Candidatus Komeilibacteria bacterium]